MARPVWECVGTGMSVAPAMGNRGITPRRASLGHPLTTARPPRRRSSGGEGGEADRTSRDTCTPIRRPASAACRRHRCFSRHGRHGGGQRHRGSHKNRRCRLRPVAWAGGRRLVGSGTGGSEHRAGPHLHQTQTADGTSPSPSRPHTALCAAHKKTRQDSCPRASSWSSFIATRPVACLSPYSPYWRSITATVDSSSLCAISLSKAAKVDSH